MGPSCHGLLIYYIFLITIWLFSVLLPLGGNVIYNQFQQIPYALGWENKWCFNITLCRRVSSSPDPSSCWVYWGFCLFVCFFNTVCSPAPWRLKVQLVILQALAQLLRVRYAGRLRSSFWSQVLCSGVHARELVSQATAWDWDLISYSEHRQEQGHERFISISLHLLKI